MPAATKPAKPKTRGAAMLATVKELCSFENRLAGTDSERRAHNRMAERLRELGRGADVEPMYVHPQAPLVYAAHCALGFAASLVAVALAPAGFALALVVATSLYLDLNTRFYLLRSLFFRRVSQNVVSRGDRADAPARLIVSAHVDVARTGAIFQPKRAARAARLAKRLPFTYGPFRPVFWSLALLIPILGLRMAGLDTNVVSLPQLVPTLTLLASVFLLVDVELSDVVPGANDNASGVAVALELAERLGSEPPENLDVWVVLTGAEESAFEGMRSFVRSHKDELDKANTFFVNIDSVGSGELRFVTAQGLATSFDMDPRLTQLCDAIAEADRAGDDVHKAKQLRMGFADDAFAARYRGYRAISLTRLEPDALTPARYHTMEDLPQHVDEKALEGTADFALELIGALDRDIGRVATAPAPEPAPGSKADPVKRRRGRRR